MAGVHLQKLIIEATPASKDQDHIQVVCFTNPKIPDRTASLGNDNGTLFLEALVETSMLLLKMEVDILLVPCITAHARFRELAIALPVPILNIIDASVVSVAKKHPEVKKIGILATDGTLQENLFQKALKKHSFVPVILNQAHQKKLMKTIYGVKGGATQETVQELYGMCRHLIDLGAELIILGCTELSLYFDELRDIQDILVDPLRIAAKQVVENANTARPS